jgi:FtsH-binding integral membrane protein
MTKDRHNTVLGWATQPWPSDTERHPTHPDLDAPPRVDAPLFPAGPYPQPGYVPSYPPPSWTSAQHPAPPRASSAAIPYGAAPPVAAPPPVHMLYAPSPHGGSSPYPASPYEAPSAYGAPSPYGEPSAYGAPSPYGESSPYGTPHAASPHGAPSPYGSPPDAGASRQDPTVPYRFSPPQHGAPPAGSFGVFADAPIVRPSSGRAIHKADATAGISDRARFIRLTYLHLLLAMLAFGGALYMLMNHELLVARVSAPLVQFALGGRAHWAIVLVAFMAISWVADFWASHARSRAMQYAGLGFYVVAESLIFVPLLAIVEAKTQAILARGGVEPHIVRDAAFVTLGIFTALTASVWLSRKDFSFLRSGLAMASGAALTAIALSLVFGFSLGLVFSIAMVLLAGAYILYQTSQVLAHHDPRQHVAAALALFSSVALMFWYVIRIFLRARD